MLYSLTYRLVGICQIIMNFMPVPWNPIPIVRMGILLLQIYMCRIKDFVQTDVKARSSDLMGRLAWYETMCKVSLYPTIPLTMNRLDKN